jgi:hypothetical protein
MLSHNLLISYAILTYVKINGMKQLFFCMALSFGLSHAVFSQFTDDFSDGDFINAPAWSGDISRFRINPAGQLQLDAPAVSGEAYLSTESAAVADAVWSWQSLISVNPSGSNYTRVYLMSDQADLSGPLQGYFVKIGGTSDEVSLFRQDGTSTTRIIDGLDDRVDASSVNIEVSVSRDATGNWELSVRPDGEATFTLEGTVFDNTYTLSSYTGAYCDYTSTRSEAFSFDNFNVSGSPVPDTTPPQLVKAEAPGEKQLRLIFSEPITPATASQSSHYLIDGQSTVVLGHNEDTVWLESGTALPNGQPVELSISGLEDSEANLIRDTTLSVLYFEAIPATVGDMVINEFMADPNPGKGTLPEDASAEFIELYNASDHPFQLRDWQVNTKSLSGHILLPDTYLIICREEYAADYATFGDVMGLSDWPALSNSGGSIHLTDASGQMIDSLAYEGREVEGGYSLERIRPRAACGGKRNFALSRDPAGASPGRINTVFDDSEDETPPRLIDLEILAQDSLLLTFDERVYFPQPLSAVFSLKDIKPVQATYAAADSVSLYLKFETPFQQESKLTIEVNGAADCSGNVTPIQTLQTYYDRRPPSFVNYQLLDTAEVALHFSEKIKPSSAHDEANFRVLEGPELLRSRPYGDSSSVLLSFGESFQEELSSRLLVSGLEDSLGNTIPEEHPEEIALSYYSDLDTIQVVNAYELHLFFHKAVAVEQSGRADLFRLDADPERPALVKTDTQRPKLVKLIFREALRANRLYELEVSQLKDTADKPLMTPLYRFSYDTGAPQVDEIKTLSDKLLHLTFDEEIRADSSQALQLWLNEVVRDVEDFRIINGKQLELTLARSMKAETNYELKIAGLQDQFGNPVDNEKSYSFLFDLSPPRLDSAYLAAPDQLRLVFHEALLPDAEVRLVKFPEVERWQFMSLNPKNMLIHFSAPLPAAKLELGISGLADEQGNVRTDTLYFSLDNRLLQALKVWASAEQTLNITFNHKLNLSGGETTSFSIGDTSADSLQILNDYQLQAYFPLSFMEKQTYHVNIKLPEAKWTLPFTFDDQVHSLTWASEESLLIDFEIPLSDEEAENIHHFNIPGHEISASLYLSGEQRVKVLLSSALPDDTNLSLHISGLKDTDGFPLPASFHALSRGRSPQRYDLLITEIMADPTPGRRLPEVEYVELYNATSDVLNLQGIRFADSRTTVELPAFRLEGGEYLLLCNKGDENVMGAYGKTIGLNGFPSLNVGGDSLSLSTKDGQIIYQLAYKDSWYNDAYKKEGGWSLEMIDTDWPCRDRDNWTASADDTGGTPARPNASAAENPDLRGPALVGAYQLEDTLIRLDFNEKLAETVSSSARIFLDETPIQLSTMSDDRLSLFAITKVLEEGKAYRLRAEGVTDCSGNLIRPEQREQTLLIPQPHEQHDIIISEFLSRPRSGGTDFVELYNTSDKFINLKNWKLVRIRHDAPAEGIVISEKDLIIPPHSYLALSEDLTGLKKQYAIPEEAQLYQTADFPNLPAEEGSFALEDDTDRRMQYINYHPDWHHPLIQNSRGVSLERIDFEGSENLSNSWQSAASTAGFATPGYQNSQWRRQESHAVQFYAEPQVFFPDQSGYRDFTLFHFELDDPGSLVSIQIYNLRGQLIRQLASNISLSQISALRWDGTDDGRRRAGAGHYIVRAEVFEPGGGVNVMKTKVVIGSRF